MGGHLLDSGKGKAKTNANRNRIFYVIFFPTALTSHRDATTLAELISPTPPPQRCLALSSFVKFFPPLHSPLTFPPTPTPKFCLGVRRGKERPRSLTASRALRDQLSNPVLTPESPSRLPEATQQDQEAETLPGCAGRKVQRARNRCSLLSSFPELPKLATTGTPGLHSEPLGILGAPTPAQCRHMTRRQKTNDLQGAEVSSSIKHWYVFNSSPWLANLPQNKGCAGLWLGPVRGQGQATVSS